MITDSSTIDQQYYEYFFYYLSLLLSLFPLTFNAIAITKSYTKAIVATMVFTFINIKQGFHCISKSRLNMDTCRRFHQPTFYSL